METKVELAHLTLPPGDTPPVRFVYAGGSVTLTVQIEPNRATGFRFGGVRAYRERAESHCTEWHIPEAFDSLVEVQGSRWVEEIRADTATGWKDSFTLRHFMLYLESVGCFEVMAASWDHHQDP